MQVPFFLCIRYVGLCISVWLAYVEKHMMTQNELTKQVLKQATQANGKKKLSCHRAHVLAEDLAVSLQAIGAICQEQDVKIVNCQLGCFGDKTGV